MNSIYNINKLSALFSEKTGHKSDVSLSFIMGLFHTVADGLKESGNVKIKGFGEFIVDAGRQVVFKPEESLEERINEPFSIFEPVEVEPELTAAIESDDIEEMEEIAEVSEEPVVTEPIIQEKEPEEKSEQETQPQAETVDTKFIEAQNRAAEAEQLAEELRLRAEEAEKQAEEAERKILEAQKEAEDARRQAVENQKFAENAPQKVKYVPVKADSGRSVLMFILGLCIGIILGGAAVYFIPFLMS